MQKLKEMLLLDSQGTKGLKKAVLACLLTSLSLMIPFTITLQVFNELMKPLMGEAISWNRLWLLFAIGVIGFALIFFLSKNDYKKTYVNSYNQAEGMRLRVAEHMRKLPMSFFNSRDVSELAGNIMSDCTNIEQTMSSAIPQLLANIISISLVCILLAFFDWRMALAVFITLPLALLVFWLSRKIQGHAFKGQIEAKLESEKQSQEYIEGIKVIRSCGLEGDKFKALDDAFVALKKASLKVELVSGSALALSSMLLRAGVGVTAFVGVLLLTGGQINFLTMLMFLLIVVRIYGPLLTVLTLLPDLLYLKVSSKRLRVLMETLPLEGQQKEPLSNCDIEFKKVTFGYNEEDVLKEVSFTAPSNKITALVGPSGSGKSTILKLIGHFWDVDTGKICIGGKDIKELDPEYLLEHISVVFQEVTLFNDTIENNIRIGKKEASDGEVRAVAKAACCDEFVRQLPDGYQTLLGENGSTLSGGERQRISIARALLKDAPIILLDEATASLDPENEVLIQKAISKVVENKTTIVVAHRLKTIQQADQILVFDEGRVKEVGTHQELLALNGLYHRLWKMQQLSLNWNI